MAVKLADAIVAMAADVESLRNDLNKGKTATDETASAMESRTSVMGNVMQGVYHAVGGAIVNFASSAVSQASAYISDAIGAASDLNETTSKIGVIFGDASQGVLDWAENADTALGQSKQQALDAAATFATFGKSAGLSGDDLNKFSTDFVGLASDLASFNNTTPEQAINAIGAALRGESEPLRAYGVLLDDASMRQKALELGLISTTKEALTPQQKVLAAQALIYQQTAAAQGDFARTSGGLANQQRILDAQMTNLKATVGTALLPVWLQLVGIMNNLATTVLPPLADFIQSTLVPVFQVLAMTIQAIWDVLSGNEPLGDWANLWESIAGIMGPELADRIYDIVAAIDDIRLAIIPAVQAAMQWFSGFRSSVENDATGPMAYFKSWIDENLPRIQTLVSNILSAIQTFWANHGDAIMVVVDRFMNAVSVIFDTVFKTILDLVTLALQVLTGDWEGAGETLKGIVHRLWDAIYEIIRLAIDSIKAIFSDFDWSSIGSNMMGGIRNGIAEGASWIYDSTLGAVQKAYNSATSWLGIRSPSERAKQGIGRPFVQGIAQGIQGEIGRLTVDVNTGLGTLMAGVQLPQLAPVAAGPGMAMPNITIHQNFNGQADPATVRIASRDGLLAALRAVGAR